MDEFRFPSGEGIHAEYQGPVPDKCNRIPHVIGDTARRKWVLISQQDSSHGVRRTARLTRF